MPPESDVTCLELVLQLLIEHGFGGAAEVLQTLLNAAMRLEALAGAQGRTLRALSGAAGPRQWLQAQDGEVPSGRSAIGYFPSPQWRLLLSVGPEKGECRERALKLALRAEIGNNLRGILNNAQTREFVGRSGCRQSPQLSPLAAIKRP